MAIRDEADLERAVQEFQRLHDAPKGTPEAERRAVLDAEIREYYVQHTGELEKGRPRR